MPVETRIDKDSNLITYEATGDITLDDMRVAFEEVLSHTDFVRGMNALCIGKRSRLAISVADVQKFIQLLSKYGDMRGRDYKMAILVERNDDFGLSSLFEMGTHELPFEVRVFRKTAEANEWLGVSA